MSNNIDITKGADSENLDITLSGAGPDPESNDVQAVSGAPADRQKKAQMMARQIAMSIGDDDDSDGYDDRDGSELNTRMSQSRTREEATKERTAPSRPARTASSYQKSSQRPASRSSGSGERRPSQQRSQQAQRRSADRSRNSSSRSKKKRRRRRSSGAGTALGFMLGFIILLVGIGYFVGLILTNGAFLPNTTINGVDVSGMTLAQATETLTADTEHSNIVIYRADGSTVIITPDEYDCGDDFEQQIQDVYSAIDRKLWFKSLLGNTQYKIVPETSYDENKLGQALDKIVWGVTEPKNAYIAHTSEDGFFIVDATQGDKVDYSILKPYILEQVKNGSTTVYVADADCFYEAEIQAEDLQDQLRYYQQFGDLTITIDFDYTQEKLTLDDFSSWLEFSDDGSTYTVNESEVSRYVGYLADTYDTYGTTRKFHATLQGDIYVPQGPQGTYGWKLDQDKTTQKIMDLLEAGESVTIDPVYATRLDNSGNVFFTYKSIESSRSAETDIGSTYVEVDLSAQHIWYYENGELKFETDQVVSGLASDASRKTPAGVYEVLDKNTNYYMSGTGYSNVHCNYFIRLSYEGIGFHDLSRAAYGGQIYLTNGSHGCLNMKLAEVKQLFNLVAGGTPVIMYY